MLPLDLPEKLLEWSSSQILRLNILKKKEKEKVLLSFLANFETWTSHYFTPKIFKARTEKMKCWDYQQRGLSLHCITLIGRTLTQSPCPVMSISWCTLKRFCSYIHPVQSVRGFWSHKVQLFIVTLLLPFFPNHRT